MMMMWSLRMSGFLLMVVRRVVCCVDRESWDVVVGVVGDGVDGCWCVFEEVGSVSISGGLEKRVRCCVRRSKLLGSDWMLEL